ncbi:hypothetical protein B0T26DRAFT_676023 [Lasiosphaeria miniovina]|uniref:Uncharacterized protein n=1 Tax=Lasiosphaeria miniovina TaxID=1954250 RepID=A0AA40DXY5_9PEZI|nr:uncharacterized protein B0T26DRAFT_676023 [Lasiosphaeria miniovina]KAK0717757.1 hypothetical protein B0T26DRAFT_676023 [Lasiosphaeria miniovina]
MEAEPPPQSEAETATPQPEPAATTNAEPTPSEEADESTWWSARKPTPESAEYPYVDKYRFGIGIVTPANITETRPGLYIGDLATHWFDQRAALRALVPAANHLYIVFEDEQCTAPKKQYREYLEWLDKKEKEWERKQDEEEERKKQKEKEREKQAEQAQ